MRVESILNHRGKLSRVLACALLGVHRSNLYYQPKTDAEDFLIINLIREIWTKYPFYGYRKITCELRTVHGLSINRKRVLRLMRESGIQALYAKPRTSMGTPGAEIYAYLLKDLPITRPLQACMVDITYLRFKGRFVYLIAVIDVYSRFVLGWHLHDTLDTEGCVQALKNALKHGKPEILNSDQGTQFTSAQWCEMLKHHGIRISMTGQGRCIDNVFIERLWRTIKYEAVYLNEYDDWESLKLALKQFIRFYNEKRYHQALEYRKPAEVYAGIYSADAVTMRRSKLGEAVCSEEHF